MKKRIVIIGKVHNVGYRPFLLGVAESIEIRKFCADNLIINNEEAVEILIEEDADKISNFIEVIKSRKPEKAEVKDIKIYDYEGYVMKAESYYRYLTSTQLSTIATYGGYMLEKQDETINEIRALREDLKAYMDERFRRIEEEIKLIKEKLGLP